MTTLVDRRPAPTEGRVAWADAILRGLGRLPPPLWLTLAALVPVGILVIHATMWAAGPLPVGEFDLFWASGAVFPVAFLAAIRIQRGVTLSALDRFRPALSVDDEAFDRIAADLTWQPPRSALVGGIVMGLVGLVSLLSSPELMAELEPYPAGLAAAAAFNVFSYAFAGPWIVGAYRLLRHVSEHHRKARRVDLFHPGPVHAFSQATATVSVTAMAIVTFSMLTDPAGTLGTPAGLALSLFIAVLAAACFFVPLWGMHRRLQAERERLLADLGTRLQVTVERLYRNVDGETGDSSAVDDNMSALLAARGHIERMSTWPWQPETPRWLISALLVPLAIWSATRFLERTGL